MVTDFTEHDRWLFNGGRHHGLGNVLGAQPFDGGTTFRVWAPNAEAVSVVGDFNGWNPDEHSMYPSESGVWEVTVPDVGQGAKYKYSIKPKVGERRLEKADPVAFHAETRPNTASIVWGREFEWGDSEYMDARVDKLAQTAPVVQALAPPARLGRAAARRPSRSTSATWDPGHARVAATTGTWPPA